MEYLLLSGPAPPAVNAWIEIQYCEKYVKLVAKRYLVLASTIV